MRRRRVRGASTASRRAWLRFVLQAKNGSAGARCGRQSSEEILRRARRRAPRARRARRPRRTRLRVRVVADGAEAVEHRQAEPGEDVPVGSASDGGLAERGWPSPRTSAAPREEIRRRRALERRDLRGALDAHGAPGRRGRRRAKRGPRCAPPPQPSGRGRRRARTPRAGRRVHRRARGDERRRHRRAELGPGERGGGQQLVGELERGVHALLGVRPGCAARPRVSMRYWRRPCAPSSARRPRSARARAPPRAPPLSPRSGRATTASPFLVGGQQDRRRRRSPLERSEREEELYDSRLHVEDARAPSRARRRTANGHRASVPSGQTVSRWPIRSTRGPSPSRQREVRAPVERSTRSARAPRRSAASASATSADARQAPGSAVGDSASTSARARRPSPASAREGRSRPASPRRILAGRASAVRRRKPNPAAELYPGPSRRARTTWNDPSDGAARRSTSHEPATCASRPRRRRRAAERAGDRRSARSTPSPSSTRARGLSLASGRTTASRRRRRACCVRSPTPGTSSPARSTATGSSASRRLLRARDDELHLHSHITGVDRRVPEAVARVRPEAVPAQLGACARHATIRWTADPLVRGNALLQPRASSARRRWTPTRELLRRPRGRGERPGDSDRVLLRWELASDRAGRGRRPASARACVRPERSRRPPRGTDGVRSTDALSRRRRLLAWIPEDIVARPEERSGAGACVAAGGARHGRTRPRRRVPAPRRSRVTAGSCCGDEARERRAAPHPPAAGRAVPDVARHRARPRRPARARRRPPTPRAGASASRSPSRSTRPSTSTAPHDVHPPASCCPAVRAPATSPPRRRGVARAGAAAIRWRRRRSRWRSSTPSSARRASSFGEFLGAVRDRGRLRGVGRHPRAPSTSCSTHGRRVPRRGLPADQAEDRARPGHRAGARRPRALRRRSSSRSTPTPPTRSPTPPRLAAARRVRPAADRAAAAPRTTSSATPSWRRSHRTPICLDESITSARSPATRSRSAPAAIVNIKAGRVGGYLEARRIHDVCAAHGVPVWCGGMLETGIGRAANVALAALPGFTLPGDTSASGRYYAQDITEPFVLRDGRLERSAGSGARRDADPGDARRAHDLAQHRAANGPSVTWRRSPSSRNCSSSTRRSSASSDRGRRARRGDAAGSGTCSGAPRSARLRRGTSPKQSR